MWLPNVGYRQDTSLINPNKSLINIVSFSAIVGWVRQNKKYRCAIGKTLAGSQVNNSPSALTA